MLFIDQRVGSREIAYELPQGSYTLTDLDVGDVSFLGYGQEGPMTYPVGIERKAYYDLVECFQDGRLNSQIRDMTKIYRRIYLIVEGRPRLSRDNHLLVPRKRNGSVEWVESKLSYSTIDNYVNTLVDEFNIREKRSFNLKETAMQVEDIFNHCSSARHTSHLRQHIQWEVVPFMQPSFKKRVAIQLDGVGEQKADDICTTFDCVYTMVLAEEEEWKKIPGIGKILAKKIVNQFRRG